MHDRRLTAAKRKALEYWDCWPSDMRRLDRDARAESHPLSGLGGWWSFASPAATMHMRPLLELDLLDVIWAPSLPLD